MKRGRGRPVGTGKDDAPTLSRMADLMLANPNLRATTAMKRILDTIDPPVIRRLQVKWRAEADRYLEQARARRAVAATPSRRTNAQYTPRTTRQLAGAQRAIHDALGMSHLASIQAALNNPALRAAREMMGSPAMLAAQEAARRYRESPAMQAIEAFRSSPTMRAIEELQNSPAMQAMRELQSSPGMQAAREAALEIEKVQRLIAGGF
jgi:hypothetical protein